LAWQGRAGRDFELGVFADTNAKRGEQLMAKSKKQPDHSWQKGTSFRCDAGEAAAALEEIRSATGGRLAPGDIVDAAKSPAHVLHGDFEWDNKKAGRLYRIVQAKHILRSIMVRPAESPQHVVRQFYPVKRAPIAGEPVSKAMVYSGMEAILADPDQRADLLNRALKELIAVQKKFRALQELAPVFRALNEVLETVEP